MSSHPVEIDKQKLEVMKINCIIEEKNNYRRKDYNYSEMVERITRIIIEQSNRRND